MSVMPGPIARLLDSIPGPIFAKELNAAGRRKSTYWLRGLFVLGMTALVAVTVSGQIAQSIGATSLARVQGLQGLAPQVAASIIWFEAICLTLAAAARSGGAICDERRKGSLASLLTTPLKTWQIIGGKVLAGVAEVMLLAATALPILLAVRIFGGVTTHAVLVCFSVMLSSIILTVCCTVLCSGYVKRSPSATLGGLGLSGIIQFGPLIVYGIMNLAGVAGGNGGGAMALSTPVSLGWLTASEIFSQRDAFSPSMGPWWWSIAYAGGFSLLCLVWCTVVVRRIAREESVAAQAAPGTSSPKRSWWTIRVAAAARTNSRTVGDQPVYWRESQQGPRWISRLVIFRLLAMLVLVPLLWYANSPNFDDTPFHVVSVLGGIICLVAAATVTAGSISGERESRSLDVLLTTPLSAREIVRGKFLGALRHRWFLLGVIELHYLIVGCGIFHHSVWPLLFYPLIIVPPVAMLCASGIWLSTITRKTSTAAALNLSIAAALWIGLPLVASIIDALSVGRTSILASITLALNPVVHLEVATEALSSTRGLRWINGESMSAPMYAAMLCVLAAGFGLASSIMLRLASRSLHRAGGV